ncbi:MAG TPA: hypothetical protein VH305_00235 [Gaiella sp.]
MRAGRERILGGAGLAALAVLGALVVALLWNGGAPGEPEPRVTSKSGIDAYGDLDIYKVHFGDTVTARLEVTVDRSRVDPDSVRVNTDFTPWEPTGAPRVVRRDGKSTTYLETRYTLRCLESFCTTQDTEAVQGFRAARITYAALDDAPGGAGQRTVQAEWPEVLVTARYAPPSASQSARQSASEWRANLLSLPAATYRVGPWALVALLLAAAALFAAAAAVIVLRTRPRRSAGAPTAVAAEDTGASVTALEYALELLEDPARVNGSGDQRRALELVADGLLVHGDRALGRIARALAWSRPVPKIDETSGIAREARAVFGRKGEADAPAL